MLESTERSFHKKFTDLGISFPSFTCKSPFQPSANILLYAEAYPGAALRQNPFLESAHFLSTREAFSRRGIRSNCRLLFRSDHFIFSRMSNGGK